MFLEWVKIKTWWIVCARRLQGSFWFKDKVPVCHAKCRKFDIGWLQYVFLLLKQCKEFVTDVYQVAAVVLNS